MQRRNDAVFPCQPDNGLMAFIIQLYSIRGPLLLRFQPWRSPFISREMDSSCFFVIIKMNESRLPCGPAADCEGGSDGITVSLYRIKRGTNADYILFIWGKNSLYFINLRQLNVYLFLFVALKAALLNDFS